MKGVVWSLSAMEHFARLSADALGWQLILDGPVPDCDVVYIMGMYDPPFYATTLANTKRAKKRIIQWCGTDSKVMNKDLLPEALHLASNDMYRDIVRSEGFECETLMMPTANHYEVTPLPETPTIAAYFGNNAESYGAAYIRMLSDAFPDAGLHTYFFNEYDTEEMQVIMASTTVQVQLGNDGGGHSLREAMEAGRYAVTTLPLKHASVVHHEDIPRIVREVGRALRQTEPNHEAAAYWKDRNTTEAFVRGFHELTGI